MLNLRVLSVEVNSSTSLTARFTSNLSSDISTDNVIIQSDYQNIPDAQVLSVSVVEESLNIRCLPLTPNAPYTVIFKSATNSFSSSKNDAILYEDNVTNKVSVLGPVEVDNVIKDYFSTYFRESIYNVDDPASIIGKLINAHSTVFAKALYDIRQLRNENYISYTVVDEKKTRGIGAFDRLAQEGAYSIDRVGLQPTSAKAVQNLIFEEFSSDLISLIAVANSNDNSLLNRVSTADVLEVNSTNNTNTFNPNTLTITLDNKPVTKLLKVTFNFYSINAVYEYDISKYGYRILDSKYDTTRAFTYLLIGDNQLILSEDLFKDPDFLVDDIAYVSVEYEYKHLGKIVDSNTLSVFDIKRSVREVLPAISKVFTLKHANLTDQDGEALVIGGLSFTNPNSNVIHHAFTTEIPYRVDALPSRPGEYSVEYETGTLYVYGESNSNDGTGATPPLVTYYYKHTYVNDVDYIYDPDSYDLAALPFGQLLNNSCKIVYNYEQVLIKGKDYNAEVHKENLAERVNNKLLSLNSIRTNNAPITNVFRVYNETTGEIYPIIRWNHDKIYFDYTTPPNVISLIQERVSFHNVVNETLSVREIITGYYNKIFKIELANEKIISSSEDGIGSSFNSSLSFSDGYVFNKEIWYDRSATLSSNLYRLTDVGEYCVDYVLGIVYCAVDYTQPFDIGSCSYKRPAINPIKPHIITVDDIYFRVNPLYPKDKNFTYTSFEDDVINISDLEFSDETDINLYYYQVDGYGNVGTIGDTGFVSGVNNNIKNVRGIYEHDDLRYNKYPINFGSSSYFDGNYLNVGTLSYKELGIVNHNLIDGYYVQTSFNYSYASPNITAGITVIRNSDSSDLWLSPGTIVYGQNCKLILSSDPSLAIGQTVYVTFNLTINNLSRVVVDYNKGDMYVDYTYLNDEIVVAYEYGENQLDFRQSTSISTGATYYVTYKVGALRDALAKNFGTLINIPELSELDITIVRERYRDLLSAALESFIQGPTIEAIKTLVRNVTHVTPELIESSFNNWSLGQSLLTPTFMKTYGEFVKLPCKYDDGLLFDKDQTLTFPINSNFRFEEGTFETWIMPQWNGIDNLAEIVINITKNGLPIDYSHVFVGQIEKQIPFNTELVLTKDLVVKGTPIKNKDGVFIYYDQDPSGLFDRWYLSVLDGYADGYSLSFNANYKVSVKTNGKFYDAKLIDVSGTTFYNGLNSAIINIVSSQPVDKTFTFVADKDKYIFDFGKDVNKSRFSVFKDPYGYLNLSVYDRNKNNYIVSADVSLWKENDLHHIAASWNINTGIDELRLFIDGLEVPNIVKYGMKAPINIHQRYRTVSKEDFIGVALNETYSSNDMVTTAGSNVVSSIAISQHTINIGDTIHIDEVGFSNYTITGVSGQTLTLSSNMPFSLKDVRYTINRFSITVDSEIDIYNKYSVSTLTQKVLTVNNDLISDGSNVAYSYGNDFISLGITPGNILRLNNSGLEEYYTILYVNSNSLELDVPIKANLAAETFYIYSEENELNGSKLSDPWYSLSKDVNYNNVITIKSGVLANDIIFIKTYGSNNRRVIKTLYNWSNTSNFIIGKLPSPISLDEVVVNKIIYPSSLINVSMIGLPLSNIGQPSYSDFGRTLDLTISGSNTDFTFLTSILIDGYSGLVPVNEVVNFSTYGTVSTTNLFTQINNIYVTSSAAINPARPLFSLLIKEKYNIFEPELNSVKPVIKNSFQIRVGTKLNTDVSLDNVYDPTQIFSAKEVGNYLRVTSPPAAVGYYKIIDLYNDNNGYVLETPIPISVVNGSYEVINVSTYRSGFGNGSFLFEKDGYAGQPYPLTVGWYEFDYHTNLDIRMDSNYGNCYYGSDFNGHNQAKSILNGLALYSVKLSDVRDIDTASSIRTVTKDYQSLKKLTPDQTTLVLSYFGEGFVNNANYYISENSDNALFYSENKVNNNFDRCLSISNKPLIIDNSGIINCNKEGTIEFWVNPKYDTRFDNHDRFYFDALGTITEEVISDSNNELRLSSSVSQVLSVTLVGGDPSVDYFAGGSITYTMTNSITKTIPTTINNLLDIRSSNPNNPLISQILSIRIANDVSDIDYVNGAILSQDKRTIFLTKNLPYTPCNVVIKYKPVNFANTKNSQLILLNKLLPSHRSKVKVTYLPKGINGDRMSIFKDKTGFINFSVRASGIDYVVKSPVYWAKNTWHRVKATFRFNTNKSQDEMHLFLDGYERGNLTYGVQLVYGDPVVYGSSYTGFGNIGGNIRFKDVINQFVVGGDYKSSNIMNGYIDNLRISSVMRSAYKVFGDNLDFNYSSNLQNVFPVTEDLYTTYLLDFDKNFVKTDDFTTLVNRANGGFDFYLNIYDSFSYVSSSAYVKDVMEKLIKILKPASSRAFISYV